MNKLTNSSIEKGTLDIKPLLTAEQVAELLNCSKAAVYAWAQEGSIPSVKINGARRFIKEDILDWINDCAESSNGYNNPAGRRPIKERRD